MEITEIRITLRGDDKLRGFASITLDNKFVVRGLKVIEGANGLFVAMPNRKRRDGSFQDIAHPINAKTRNWMENEVIAEYKKELLKVENVEISLRVSDNELSAMEDNF
ncbi:MAG: septation regulator SpoVG [bacterium]|nr:septation regulator SpoVG [bacterium]MCP4800207.1 septation regulator SpoVG [bacterium]